MAAVAIMLAVLAGCSSDAPEPAPESPEPALETPESTPETPDAGTPDAPSGGTGAGATADAPSAGAANTPPDLDAVELTLEPVVELEGPTAMATRSGDDSALYIAEIGGRVVRVVDGAVDGQPVLDISDQTTPGGERGLLGIDFSDDGTLLYVSYTNREGDTRLDEYRMDGNRAATGTRRSVLQVEQPYPNHNGGNVVFGPDGQLYFGLGDGGSGGDPHGHGQDRSTLLGSLLRIDPSSGGGAPYRVPDDNPFVDEGNARPEIWAYGLRNPWRFSFDRQTGDLWIGDVGQDAIEEIDWVPFDQVAGTNFGWNIFEGSERFTDGQADNAVPPVHEYRHTPERHTVIGGYVYRGRAIDGLNGAYLYSDLYDGVIRGLVLDNGEITDKREFAATVPQIVSFGEDARGELYALSLAGPVFRLTAG
jgi:glucose/arabinose dehydrogenase